MRSISRILITGFLLFFLGLTTARAQLPGSVEGKPYTTDSSVLHEPNIQVSAGFMSNLGGSGSYQYLRPGLQLPVSERFSLRGGLLLSRGGLYNGPERITPANGLRSSAYLDIGGTYNISDRLTLEGDARLPLNTSKAGSAEFAQFQRYQQQRAFRFEASYEIAEHVQIEAGMQYQEGGYPLRRSGPQRGLFNNRFRQNGFSSGFGGRRDPFGAPGW
jgi:hypothetical protein